MNICGALTAFLKLQRMHFVPLSVRSKIDIVAQSIKYLLTFDVFPVPCFLKRIHCIWIFYLNCVFGCCKDVSLVDHFKGDNPVQSCWITQWQCMTAGRSACLSLNGDFSVAHVSSGTCLLQVFMSKWERNRLQKNAVKQSGNFICNLSWGNIKTFVI